MIEIFKDKLGDYDYVCEYRIFSLEDKLMFDFIQKLYTDNNKWGKQHVLSDVIVHRCELKDILNVFDEDRDNFEEILNNNLDDVSCIEDEMNAIENCVILRISLPHRKFIVDNGIKKDFRGYKDTFYPIEVIVKPNEYSDYSRYFMDFYDYEEKAVDEAYKVLTSDNYPCDLKDMQTFEKTLIKNIESREELGLK